MQRYFDPIRKRLVYIGAGATPQFWDQHWQADNLARQIRMPNTFVVRHTKRYLSPGSRVLEGGCGIANTVFGLRQAGFDVIGVDYAPATVKAVNTAVPELDVREGDVRDLPFPDGHFDGYWSLGVIEHFYQGYAAIMHEMRRVLRPGGMLFMTVPSMSLLRRIKAGLGVFPRYEHTREREASFYQFALDSNSVIREFEANGFKLVSRSGYSAVKGVKDEIALLKPLMSRLIASNSRPAALCRLAIEALFRSSAGHMSFFVLRRC